MVIVENSYSADLISSGIAFLLCYPHRCNSLSLSLSSLTMFQMCIAFTAGLEMCDHYKYYSCLLPCYFTTHVIDVHASSLSWLRSDGSVCSICRKRWQVPFSPFDRSMLIWNAWMAIVDGTYSAFLIPLGIAFHWKPRQFMWYTPINLAAGAFSIPGLPHSKLLDYRDACTPINILD